MKIAIQRRPPLEAVPSRTTARVTGLLYLLIIVLAGFSEGYVRSGVLVPGDAAATAANIAASEGLFRLGLVTDLAAFLCDAAVAVLLYVLLRPVDRTLSLLAAAFRLVAHPAIAGLNLLNHWAALALATASGGALGGAFEPAQREALAMLALDAHGVGYLIGGAFFGVHCLILGHLLFRAGYVPPVLGVLLGLAGAGYLAESAGTLLLPAYGDVLVWVVAVPAVVGELSLAVYLVARGVRAPPTATPDAVIPSGRGRPRRRT